MIYCRFSFCLWSYWDVYVLGPKTVTLHRHETCTVSNIIPCQIFSISGFLGRLHYTTRHFSVFLAETQNIISRENKTLQRLLLEKEKKNVSSESCSHQVESDVVKIKGGSFIGSLYAQIVA